MTKQAKKGQNFKVSFSPWMPNADAKPCYCKTLIRNHKQAIEWYQFL